MSLLNGGSILIKPVFKSGDRSDIRNYRPISLLSVTSKVLEKLVFTRIVDFVQDQLSLSQFGFLPKCSTLQQLLIFLNTIMLSPTTDVIYIDFSKAFDSVPHHELLLKLWHIGVTGQVWLWLKTYLSNRLQHVAINSAVSNPLRVISGVPQGSILGPLLP